ncbi:MAG TPA: hypothetical protein VGI40_27945 [Pirellulaceae bacterium]|jgi:hypothetical protein
MPETRHRLPLIALWLCVVYFVVFTFVAFVNSHMAPILLISDYDSNNLTQADLMAIRDDIGKLLWRGFITQFIGTIVLLSIAIWFHLKTSSPK